MLKCPDCARYFLRHTLNEEGEEMLDESFRVNPGFKDNLFALWDAA